MNYGKNLLGLMIVIVVAFAACGGADEAISAPSPAPVESIPELITETAIQSESGAAQTEHVTSDSDCPFIDYELLGDDVHQEPTLLRYTHTFQNIGFTLPHDWTFEDQGSTGFIMLRDDAALRLLSPTDFGDLDINDLREVLYRFLQGHLNAEGLSVQENMPVVGMNTAIVAGFDRAYIDGFGATPSAGGGILLMGEEQFVPLYFVMLDGVNADDAFEVGRQVGAFVATIYFLEAVDDEVHHAEGEVAQAVPDALQIDSAYSHSALNSMPESAPMPESRKFTGSGDNVITLEPFWGTYVFAISGNEASRHFSVHAHGERRSLLVNTTSPYEGITFTAHQGTTSLEISATGNWVIEQRPLEDMRTISTGETITGSGDEVLRILSHGQTATVTGNRVERHFSVHSHGERRNLLVNTTSEYSGRVMLRGTYTILEISAVGDWSIAFE